MATIRRRAVKAEQGGRVLFFTWLTVRDFVDGFYRVDKLDVHESKGIQRLLNESRARSFANDIAEADAKDECGEAFLPTSVFLATDGDIGYDESAKEMILDSAPNAGICPLDVVDGQHRIEGLKMAAHKSSHLMDFPVSVVIACGMTEPEKMLQFVTVNTKQRAVDPGVAQHIIARFTKMRGVKELPYIPRWLDKKAEKGDDDKALAIVLALNGNPKSPWRDRVQLADEKKKSPHHTIKQGSFVNSVKQHLLTSRHPLNGSGFDEEKQIGVLINFWTAVERIFVTPQPFPESDKPSAVFKSNSLTFFHAILAPVLNHLNRKKSYTVDAMEDCIRAAGEHLPPSEARIMFSDFWQVGGLSGNVGITGMRHMAAAFNDALAEANDDEILL